MHITSQSLKSNLTVKFFYPRGKKTCIIELPFFLIVAFLSLALKMWCTREHVAFQLVSFTLHPPICLDIITGIQYVVVGNFL